MPGNKRKSIGCPRCPLCKTLFLLLLLAATFRAEAQETVTIVYNAGVAPLKFEDEAGNPVGLFPDQWRAWAHKTGRQIRFIKSSSFDESLEYVKTGKADLHAGLFKTEEREAFLEYSEPFFSLQYYVFTHPVVRPMATLDDVSGLLIGIQRGGHTEQFVRSRVPEEHIIIYDSFDELFRAAMGGKIKVFVATRISLFYFLKENRLANIFGYESSRPLYTQVYHTASAKGNTTLIDTVNDG